MRKVQIMAAAIAIALVLSSAAATPASSQILGGLVKKAKEKVDERAARKADSLMDKSLDKADNTVTCALSDESCADAAKRAGKRVVVVDANGAPITALSGGVDAAKAGEGAWLNYDFVPGDRVVFAEDFTTDEVGNFPRRLQFKSGNMEIAEWQGARYLRASSRGLFTVELPAVLPERFTLEFDIARTAGYPANIRFTDDRRSYVAVECYGVGGKCEGGITGPGSTAIAESPGAKAQQVMHARVMADGQYAKVYLNSTRVANVPNADLGRSKHIVFEIPGSQSEPTLIGSIRIGAGGKKLYDALSANGRVSTHGILFDVGSDHIRPESTPTLKEIAAMLRDHPDLKLAIEGHTDAQGDPAANQALSERRAEAVKQSLVDSFNIDAARLTNRGFGSSKPVVPNTTPEGRQQNRRVELVRA